VFLTHFTAPPASFAAGDINTYGVPWQPVCRWPDVWRWLNANASAQPATAWQAFAKELADFLGEQEMTSEMMTQHDLAALAVYLPSATRVNNLFNHIYEAVTADWEFAGQHNTARSTIEYQSDASLIWDWGYVRSPNTPHDWSVWFLGWGIAFPERPPRQWDDAIPPLPKRAYAFFGLFTEKEEYPIPSDPRNRRWGLGDDWSACESDCNSLITARAMCDFDPDPDRLAEQFTDWVKKAGAQLKAKMRDIVRAVPS